MITLKDFYSKKDKILIYQNRGGLGDALMQRMLFDEVKKTINNCDLIFACLEEHIDAFIDHPAISSIVDVKKIKLSDYGVCYDTCVTVADRYENYYAPCKEHRSDIWAKTLKIELSTHDMNFRLDKTTLNKCKNHLQEIKKYPDKPIVLLAPYSRMATKSLLDWQIETIVDATKEVNLVGIHKYEIKPLTNLNLTTIQNITIQEWMCYIANADYVVSVDTAAFHMAGGLKKPLVGIFTFADGKIYGKYFDFILIQKHRDNGDWDCGPCFKLAECPKSNKSQKPCLTEISEQEIRDGINKMFQKW